MTTIRDSLSEKREQKNMSFYFQRHGMAYLRSLKNLSKVSAGKGNDTEECSLDTEGSSTVRGGRGGGIRSRRRSAAGGVGSGTRAGTTNKNQFSSPRFDKSNKTYAAPVWLMLRTVRLTELVPLEAEPLALALTLAEASGAWMVNWPD